MSTLLVVDGDASVRDEFCRQFAGLDISVVVAESAAAALQQISKQQPDAAVMDVALPDQTGLEAFQHIQQLDAKLPVILTAATGDSGMAIEAMKHGALDYLVKPLDFDEVRAAVDQALEIRRLMSEPVPVSQTLAETPASGDVLVGRSPLMQLVYKSIGRVAPQNVTVLIRGESGTGKELVARALYHHSTRCDGPFMEVNSAAIPDALLESELFGHEKGSFTGAERKRIGKFEQCNGGTLFLDEIGDMSPSLQSKMLRVLQEQRFERVGGNESIRTDVRVVAATNRDLERMVADGQFRSDLYYRLNGFTIKLPPLRQRGDDLLLLVDHFLGRANQELGKSVRGVSPEAIDLLKRYPWPGNVRELQSVIRQAVLQTGSPVLVAHVLPESIRDRPPDAAPPAAPMPIDYWDQFVAEQLKTGTNTLYDQALHRMEAELILRVLRHTNGNQIEAAKLLGLSRTTLRMKIRQLVIAIDRVVNTDDQHNG